MLPISIFLSCTEVLDGSDSLSYHQTHPAKTYVTGLATARSKTVEGIARGVLPANGECTLNRFLAQDDWDVEALNHECLDELQNQGEARWSQDGYIVIDDSVNQRTRGEFLVQWSNHRTEFVIDPYSNEACGGCFFYSHRYY